MRTTGAVVLGILLSFFYRAASADTTVSGTIGSATTWTVAGSPYVATGSVTVSNGVTLTIEPGVRVEFAGGVNLHVYGRLMATGTATDPIVLTSSAPTPTRGSWGGVDFNTGTNPASRLSHLTVSYAGALYGSAAVRVYSGAPELEHLTIVESSTRGLHLRTPASLTLATITVTDCSSSGIEIAPNGGAGSLHSVANATIARNGSYGVNLTYGAKASIVDSTIDANGDYAISTVGTTDLTVASTTASGNGGGAKDAIGYRGSGIGANEIWRPASIPLRILGAVTVHSGKTLTLTPGITVTFAGGAYLRVSGRILAAGTANEPIILTSSAASPTRGSWGGLDFMPASNPASQLSHVTVSYAGGYLNTAVRVWDGSPSFEHVTITESSTHGLHLRTIGGVALESLTVTNCSSSGIEIEPNGGAGALHSITNATITANGGHGVNLRYGAKASIGGSAIDANGNFAIGAEGTTDLAVVTTTAAGNAGGAKDAIGYRGSGIAGDEVWRPSSIPLRILGAVPVQSGRTLTIQPGVSVFFDSGVYLRVSGRLLAEASPMQPILLTSSAATPTRGSWGGVDFMPGTNPDSKMSHVTVSYAGGYQSTAVRISNGSPAFDDVTITESSARGLYSVTTGIPAFENLTISNCTSHAVEIAGNGSPTGVHVFRNALFTGNGGYGVTAGWGGRVQLSHSSIFGNGAGGVTSSTEPLDARFSHWGSADGPSGSGFGTGSSVNAKVTFEPWLAASPSSSPRIEHVTHANRTFNPSIATTSQYDFLTVDAGSWTLNLTTLAGTPVQSYSGTASPDVAAWDGLDSQGSPAADGTYVWELQATGTSGTAAPVRGRVIVDSAKRLSLSGLVATPSFFSPNGDGNQETTSITAVANFDDVAWTIEVLDPGAATIRTHTGTGAQITFTWNGLGTDGTLQPDALYGLSLTATAGTDQQGASGSVTLDARAPLAQLDSPTVDQVVSNVYQNGSADFAVIGTASDGNLTSWTLDYGTGDTPSSWTTIATGASSSTASNLGTWQTLPLVNGRYTVRLRASDAGASTSTALASVTLGNFRTTQNRFDVNPAVGGTVSYQSIVPFPLTQTLILTNEDGQVIRTMPAQERSAGGVFTEAWDGKDDSGAIVPDGPYSYIMNVVSDGGSMTWDRSGVFRGPKQGHEEWVTSLTSEFAPFANKPWRFQYTIREAARVHLEVQVGTGGCHDWMLTDCNGPNGGVVTPGGRCIRDSVYQAAGPYVESWVNTTEEGEHLHPVPCIGVVRNFWNFPQNVVVVHGTAPRLDHPEVTPAIYSPAWGDQTVDFDLATHQSAPGAVTLTVVSHQTLKPVRTIGPVTLAAGRPSITWDGRSDAGVRVAPGGYTLILTAENAGARHTLHALTKIVY